jgi:hypothetical protein
VVLRNQFVCPARHFTNPYRSWAYGFQKAVASAMSTDIGSQPEGGGLLSKLIAAGFQVVSLLPRFNAIARFEREIDAGRDPGAALPHGDDSDTARGMASLFAEVGEAHAMEISAGKAITAMVQICPTLDRLGFWLIRLSSMC